MRAALDAFLTIDGEVDPLQPQPHSVVEACLEALAQIEADAEMSSAAMELLEDRTVRYRLLRLERLAWEVAIDPLGFQAEPPRPAVCVPRRAFGTGDASGARIRTRRTMLSGYGELGREPRIAGEHTRLLPVVSTAEIKRDGRSLLDLPVGTVLVDHLESFDAGCIGTSTIGAPEE